MLQVADASTVEPWERQPGESAKAFAEFLRYRDTPAHERSLRALGSRGGARPESVTGRHAAWSMQWNWVSRSLAWDSEQDRLLRIKVTAERARMAERQMRTAQVAQNKIVEWLLALDPKTLTPHEASRWYEVAVKVERMAVGEPDRVEVTHQGQTIVVEQMSPEETVARLHEVQAQIGRLLA
jgi:hypothetical protein